LKREHAISLRVKIQKFFSVCMQSCSQKDHHAYKYLCKMWKKKEEKFVFYLLKSRLMIHNWKILRHSLRILHSILIDRYTRVCMYLYIMITDVGKEHHGLNKEEIHFGYDICCSMGPLQGTFIAMSNVIIYTLQHV
jgi:hypothetical protein